MQWLTVVSTFCVNLVISQVIDDQDFSFDHAFRKFEDFLESKNDQIALEARSEPAAIMAEPIDRMGEAFDSFEEESVDMEEIHGLDAFLRKLDNLQDQEAVEAKELKQFSSSWPKKLKRFSGSLNHSKSKKKKDSKGQLKMEDKMDRHVADGKTDRLGVQKSDSETEPLIFSASTTKKSEPRFKKPLPRLDASSYPKEHRRQSDNSGVRSMMTKARNTIMLSAGNALDTTNVGTYLATMWISNLLQTLGFSALGMMSSSASSRSSKRRSEQRGGARSMYHSDENIEDDEQHEDFHFDIKKMTAMMRTFADLADTLHDEL
jgi:hypothetical protein